MKLKNCPFCGSKPHLHKNDPYADDREHNNIKCKKCGMTGPHDEWYTLDGVIKAWNTRAVSEPLKDLADNQVDMPAEFSKVVDGNLFDLV